MDPKVNYTAVGIYVVVLSMAFAAIVLWLSSEHTKHYDRYLVYLKEPVSGLTDRAPVKFNGVDVGYVETITINPEDPQEVRLLLKIVSNTPITQSTTATLMAQGITGNTYIGLKAKTSSAPPLEKKPSEPFPVIPSEPSVLVQLNEALRDVTAGLKVMSQSFSGMNQGFKKIFTQESVDSLHNILDKASKASNQFPEAVDKIQGAAAGLKTASEQVKETLQNSEGTIKSLDVAVKNLTEQTLPEIFQAMHSLKQTMDNLKSVTAQMRQNPSVLIRGTVPPPPGPGE